MTELTQLQKQLSDHVRDPQRHPGPADVEQRRLDIYRDLFFNTVEGFLCTAFPVLRKLHSDDDWRELVRDFMRHHRCASPYFVQLAEEFLQFLSETRQPGDSDPPFLAELAHYEWVELALDISTDVLPVQTSGAQGALPDTLRLSPLAWSLAYRYPVHRIGLEFQPVEPDATPCFLLVYRNRQDAVGFLEINAATARLLALLEHNAGDVSASIAQLAEELGMDHPAVAGFARELIGQMCGLDILV